jgi:hypothetical protein
MFFGCVLGGLSACVPKHLKFKGQYIMFQTYIITQSLECKLCSPGQGSSPEGGLKVTLGVPFYSLGSKAASKINAGSCQVRNHP